MTPGVPPRPQPPVPVAISACLTGEAVRYDGSGAADALPRRELAGVFEYIAVCPEVGIGMGVPRPPIRLVGAASKLRAVGIDDPGLDVTGAPSAAAKRSVCGMSAATSSWRVRRVAGWPA